jgi:undecaprenyl-phosphate galactose phosphotransferase/putative colanic acid biosynthesis UDP-glucose lipid carrier transferase
MLHIFLLLRHGNFDRMELKCKTICWLIYFWLFLLFYKDAYNYPYRKNWAHTDRMTQHIIIHGLIAVFVGLLKYSEVSRLRLLYFIPFFLYCFLFLVWFQWNSWSIQTEGYNLKNVVIRANDKWGNIRKF